jgi:hypothetical protein
MHRRCLDGERVFVIDEFLTADECGSLIARDERSGYQEAPITTSDGSVVNKEIVLLDEARERFEAEDRWWREHRDATELFVTEVEDVLRQLTSAPAMGQRYRRVRGKPRRLCG